MINCNNYPYTIVDVKLIPINFFPERPLIMGIYNVIQKIKKLLQLYPYQGSPSKNFYKGVLLIHT